jgi:hypothetical protein
MKTFAPEVFLEIVDRMNRNMAPVMTVLMPGTMLSIVPLLLLSYHQQPMVFYLSTSALLLFLVALMVTVVVEVPIVQQIVKWTPSTLPEKLAAAPGSLDEVPCDSSNCRGCESYLSASRGTLLNHFTPWASTPSSIRFAAAHAPPK